MAFRFRCLKVWLVVVLMVSLPGLALAASTEGYRLGPQDKLDIRVYDLRMESGEAHRWAALNGEFFVDATGAVSLPLLGEVPASNGTPADLADAIATLLQNKIGLSQRPDASVQVIKYRPFYILGAVDKPGEYDYRPGLTVLQAVSVAGGMPRTGRESLLNYERDAVSERGDLRVLDSDRVNLLLRQARLDAEIAQQDKIRVPPDLAARASEPEVARALREEQLLFVARRQALASQIDSIQQAKTLLASELTSLAAKDATLGRQLDLTRKELAQISDLVAKGMAIMPRQLASEQSAASFESSRLDVQLAKLRADQDLSRADREMLDLRAKQRDEALTEAAEVRTKLATNTERTATTQRLVFLSEVRAPNAMARAGVEQEPIYRLTHRNGDTSQTTTVTENDELAPGDVLRVLIQQPDLAVDTSDNLSSLALTTSASQVVGPISSGKSPSTDEVTAGSATSPIRR